MKSLMIVLLPINLLFAGPQAGQYRGYVEIESTIKRNFFRANATFFLANLIGQQNPDGSLMTLLGTYEPNGGRYVNGNPNALSMLVWNMVAQSMATGLSQECVGSGKFRSLFNENANEQVKRVCQWAKGKSFSEEESQQVWRLVVGYVAPKSEFESWRVFVSALEKRQSDSHSERAKNLWMSLLLHPYFLMDLN